MSTWIAGKGTIPAVTTNADRIRSMTDEELAKKMSGLESFALTCGGATGLLKSGWTG